MTWWIDFKAGRGGARFSMVIVLTGAGGVNYEQKASTDAILSGRKSRGSYVLGSRKGRKYMVLRLVLDWKREE